MAGRDVAQLILEVDARIATAQRAVNQLARSVQQDAATMGGALGNVEKANARLGKALNDNGRIRAGFTQLSFQIGDVSQQMALGVSGARIFAQQSGQIIQALQVMGGEGNKFLQFMGGPWGIAISTAAVVLGPLVSKLFDTGDSVDDLVAKMREQAKQAVVNDRAQEAWALSLDGAEKAIRDVNKALDELEGKAKSTAQRELEAAEKALAVAEAHKAAAAAAIQRARAEYELQQSMASGPGQRGELAALGLPQKFGNLDAAQNELSRVTGDIASARAAVERAQSFVTVERAQASEADKINARYDQLIEQARKRAIAEHKVGDELTRQVDALTKQREAALKAADASKSGNDKQFGRQVDFTEAAKIARAAGLQVNSGYRSPSEQARLFNDPSVNRPGNPVAPPGASAHNGANGKWAIDIQITDGVTPGKIRKVFADQGVSLTKVLKEKGHFHVEGSRSDAAKAENSAESDAQKAVRQANAFAEESDRLNQELLRAKSQLVQGIDAEADASVATLQAEQERRKAAYNHDVAEGKISQANADILKAKVDQITYEKIKAVEIQRAIEHMRRADELEQRSFQYRTDDLRFADEMATTQAEHRRLQLEILDVVYQQKEAHLRALKAELELAGKIEDAADVQAQIDRLPTEKAQDSQRTLRGTMNPLEAWAHEVPKSAAEINEALQTIEAQGLDRLADRLTDVIMGTKSLGDAFKEISSQIIADIIRMTIRMLIFRAISAAFGGGGGAFSGSGADAAVGSGIYGDIGSSGLPGFATGGSMTIGGRGGTDNNLLSINGEPIARVSRGEQINIVPRAPRIGTPRGAGGGGGGGGSTTINVNVNARDAVLTSAVKGWVAQGILEAAPQIVRVAQKSTVRSLQRPRLQG